MLVELYTIRCLTNSHIGSGDINFDVIDNQVQRDTITNLPNINSSSLKGAFREHFSNMDDTKMLVSYIFGPENGDNNSHQTGAYNFFEAQLLTRPVRSNEKPYFNATSPEIIKNMLEMIEEFNIDFDEDLKKILENFSKIKVKDKPLIFEDISNTILEDEKAEFYNFDTSKLKDFFRRKFSSFYL